MDPSGSKCFHTDNKNHVTVDRECFCNDGPFLIDFVDAHAACGPEEKLSKASGS